MATPKTKPLSNTALQTRWLERVRSGQFSPAVLGVGTIKVFGKAGDAPVAFPRIESLAALDTLEADERWAVTYAQQVIEQHQRQGRNVMSAAPGQATGAVPVQGFDPSREYHLILSQIVGG
jgi:hypothetical protein